MYWPPALIEKKIIIIVINKKRKPGLCLSSTVDRSFNVSELGLLRGFKQNSWTGKMVRFAHIKETGTVNGGILENGLTPLRLNLNNKKGDAGENPS